MNYTKKQTSLIIMDKFKRQDNNEVMNLCKEILFHVVIIPHYLTNKFLTFDLTVNTPAKSFPPDLLMRLQSRWLKV